MEKEKPVAGDITDKTVAVQARLWSEKKRGVEKIILWGKVRSRYWQVQRKSEHYKVCVGSIYKNSSGRTGCHQEQDLKPKGGAKCSTCCSYSTHSK